MMNNKSLVSKAMFLIFVLVLSFTSFATNNGSIIPGSQSEDMDFSNLTRGLYNNGTDFYYILDSGVYATNFMYSFGGEKFYFGDDGKMVRDQVVQYEDQFYYFDGTGVMAKNYWYQTVEVDELNETRDITRYYFGPTGRAYRATGTAGIVIKEIDGEKFGFNQDAEMLQGYVTATGEEIEDDTEYAYAECMYYFDPYENYAATTGWHLYSGQVDESIYDPDNEMYLYFDEKTCRKVHSPFDDRYIHRTIEGQKYMFNYDGVRYHEWYGSVASPAAPKYYSEDFDGFLAKGWFTAVPAATSQRLKNKQRHQGEEEMWFYADSRGHVLRSCIKQIGKYTYAFDEDGVMQSDAFVVVTQGNKYVAAYDAEDVTKKQILYGAEDGGILQNGQKWMYFVTPEDDTLEGSRCQLNKPVKVEVKDDDFYFYSLSNGGVSDNVVTTAFERNGQLFQNGVLLCPNDSENNYGIVRRSKELVTSDPDGFSDHYYYAIVDKNGSVKTKYGAYRDKNDNYLLCRNNGEFIGIYTVKVQYLPRSGTWRYKEDKEWITGFPPSTYRIYPTDYYLNFDELTYSIADEYAEKYR